MRRSPIDPGNLARGLILVTGALLCVSAQGVLEQSLAKVSVPPIGYSSPEQMIRELKDLAAARSRLRVSVLGNSPEGRPISMATFRTKSFARTRPEGLVIANLEGDRIAASELAMELIRQYARQTSIWDQVGTLHIIPMANPDAHANVLKGGGPYRGAPVDEDRDGRKDENGVADLDGDGQILWVRTPSLVGDWSASPDDARVMEKTEPAQAGGDRFLLRREGWDEDNDRALLEDPPGGIRVDSNFPHRWPQYASEAGPYPLSEPEARIIGSFIQSSERIAWVLILDDEDNLAKPPAGKDKVDIHSTEPLKKDALYLKLWSEQLFPKVSKNDPAGADDVGETPGSANGDDDAGVPESIWTKPESAEHGPGNLADWCYYQLGLFTLESAVWTMPTGAGPKGMSEEGQRLVWADKHYAESAFRDWYDFTHPELGAIQIGGWQVLAKDNLPVEWIPVWATRYRKLIESLGENLPKLQWTDVEVTNLDDQGVVELRAKLVNTGVMPTTSAMGLKTRSRLPLQVFLNLPEGNQLLVGKQKQSISSLDGGGGHRSFRWILKSDAGAERPRLYANGPTSGEAIHDLE